MILPHRTGEGTYLIPGSLIGICDCADRPVVGWIILHLSASELLDYITKQREYVTARKRGE